MITLKLNKNTKTDLQQIYIYTSKWHRILFLNTTLFYNFLLPVNRYLTMNTFCRSMTYYQKSYSLPLKVLLPLLFVYSVHGWRHFLVCTYVLHFVCFGEKTWNCMHFLVILSWKLCELVSNIEEQLCIVFMHRDINRGSRE
jgi:hypothetical protein